MILIMNQPTYSNDTATSEYEEIVKNVLTVSYTGMSLVITSTYVGLHIYKLVLMR